MNHAAIYATHPAVRSITDNEDESVTCYDANGNLVAIDQAAYETALLELEQVSLDEVKAEAGRRIVAICPEWRQRNLTAQATLLLRKGEANWTPEDATAWAAGQVIWDQIAEIRARSDEIEVMDPIPADFRDDIWWGV